MTGLIVPVRDTAGRIVALKVRRDKATGSNKYFYITSTKYGGPGPGSPVHVPLGFKFPIDVSGLTEGELKADAASSLSGRFYLSVPGVGNWKPALDVLKELGVKVVRLAFDADACSKPVVAQALLMCFNGLRDAGFVVELERWNPDCGKGIDDLLAAGK